LAPFIFPFGIKVASVVCRHAYCITKDRSCSSMDVGIKILLLLSCVTQAWERTCGFTLQCNTAEH